MRLEPIPAGAFQVMEKTRHLVRGLATQVASYGFEPVDIVIGLVGGSTDAAVELHKGDEIAAIEWLRTALDEYERTCMAARNAH